MSICTSDTQAAMDYAVRRIYAEPTLILLVYGSSEDVIVTSIDSDSPGNDYRLLGTFYWNKQYEIVEFKATDTLS